MTFVATVLCLYWAARIKPSFALASAAAVAVSFHCLQHDLSILAVPAILVMADFSLADGSRCQAAVSLLIPSAIYGFGLALWLGSVAALLLMVLAAKSRHIENQSTVKLSWPAATVPKATGDSPI